MTSAASQTFLRNQKVIFNGSFISIILSVLKKMFNVPQKNKPAGSWFPFVAWVPCDTSPTPRPMPLALIPALEKQRRLEWSSRGSHSGGSWRPYGQKCPAQFHLPRKEMGTLPCCSGSKQQIIVPDLLLFWWLKKYPMMLIRYYVYSFPLFCPGPVLNWGMSWGELTKWGLVLDVGLTRNKKTYR